MYAHVQSCSTHNSEHFHAQSLSLWYHPPCRNHYNHGFLKEGVPGKGGREGGREGNYCTIILTLELHVPQFL